MDWWIGGLMDWWIGGLVDWWIVWSRVSRTQLIGNRQGALKSGISERLQTRVARATGPYRPATRRTERVRRSI